MNILLIAYQFPPYSNIGSLRIGKLAKHFEKNGFGLHVLCADKILMPDTLEVEISPESVHRTKWINVNFLPESIFGGRGKVINEGYQTKSSILKTLGYIYRLFLNFPDERIGWYPYAICEGNRILRQNKIDFIYASAPSPTALLIANKLSRKWGVPWVAEFRDPWADTVHYDFPEWRRKIENMIQNKIMKSASGIVTISHQLAKVFEKRFGKPTIVSMNGYAADDIESVKRKMSIKDSRLEIVYTGTVHLDIVKLDPLFEGISLLKDKAKQIKLVFYTRYIEGIVEKARKYNLEKIVYHHSRIPYKKSLQKQKNADILLFLIPHQYGIFSAKIYEYIGSLRPILAIGDTESSAGAFLLERGIGFVSKNPDEISIQLNKWIDQKRSGNDIEDLPKEKRLGLSREEQFKNIDEFLFKLKNHKDS